MMTAEILLAAALLTSPDGHPDPSLAEVLRPNIIALALDAEILDPREKGLPLGFEWLDHLVMLQGRYTMFAAVPTLGECERFPDAKFVREALAINRAHRGRLVLRLGMDLVHAEEIRAELAETDRLYQIWDAARDSEYTWYYVTVRRQSLDLLRDLITPANFYSGRLPPPVP